MDRLDQLFEDTATKQRVSDSAFSTWAELLSLVVTRDKPSVNAAYREKKDEIGVAVKSVYNKLAGIELCVSGETKKGHSISLLGRALAPLTSVREKIKKLDLG